MVASDAHRHAEPAVAAAIASRLQRPPGLPYRRSFLHLPQPLSSVLYEPTGCPAAPLGQTMSFLQEILAAIRCVRLATGLPTLWRFSRRDGHEILAHLDTAVMPLVHRTIDNPELRSWLRGAFQTATIKFGVGMWGYAAMTGRPADVRLIALSTSFTRLYDDLMDHGADESVDDRFAQLVQGELPSAVSQLELLMHELFRAIEAEARPRRPGSFYADVTQVHRWQRRSRRQRLDPSITPAEVRNITRAKGSLGILVLYTLGREDTHESERDIIRHIGAVGQMLDDLHDMPIDRQDGIMTPATAGHIRAWQVGGEVARLAARLRRHFGQRRARAFNGLLFLYQAGLIFRREQVSRRYPPVATTPLGILIGRTRNVVFDTARTATPAAPTVGP